MKAIHTKRQRGAALLALLAVIMLGASWFLVSRLNAESGMAQAAYRARNAAVLNRAKQALIGYVAAQAVKAGENNPGAVPCPEGAAFVVDTSKEGTSAPTVGAPTCASIGRFPWRTIGLEKLVDVTGEPLWYVVSPTWRKTSTTTLTNINSNTAGGVTVDGSTVVALIVAPGLPMNVQASTGCTARAQARTAPSATMDARDYLECFDSTTLQFITTAPSTSLNDQIVKVTVADVMPGIEAAVANRIEREILPALKTVYTPATWGFTGSNPVLPFAAAFSSPGPGTSTSSYQGATSTYAGLLPFNQTQGCTESATDRRCTTVTSGTSGTTGLPAFLVFSKPGSYVDTMVSGSGAVRTSSATATCVWASTVYTCTGEYNSPSIAVSVSVNVANIAMGLRTFDSTKVTCTAVDDVGAGIPVQNVTCSSSVALQSDGSAKLTVVTAALPDIPASGWGTYANYKINIDRAAFGDHALLDSTDGTTGWFVRNEWYRLIYYAVSASNTAGKVATERTCSAAPADCLTVTNMTPSSSTSALLILAGRSINGSTRPSAALADYFEFGNSKAAYERQTVTPGIIASYVDTGAANAYSVPVASLPTGAILQFTATNANTGTSTLNTSATGTRSLVNLDGSNLAAATIQANAAVQVTWDGTVFRLSKRPFNDRIVAIASN